MKAGSPGGRAARAVIEGGGGVRSNSRGHVDLAAISYEIGRIVGEEAVSGRVRMVRGVGCSHQSPSTPLPRVTARGSVALFFVG